MGNISSGSGRADECTHNAVMQKPAHLNGFGLLLGGLLFHSLLSPRACLDPSALSIKPYVQFACLAFEGWQFLANGRITASIARVCEPSVATDLVENQR